MERQSRADLPTFIDDPWHTSGTVIYRCTARGCLFKQSAERIIDMIVTRKNLKLFSEGVAVCVFHNTVPLERVTS